MATIELASTPEWARVVGIILAYGALFAAAERLRLVRGIGSEDTRKLVHVASGLLALVLPALFDSVVPVIVVALGFTIFLGATQCTGKLASIHGVSRASLGAICFPLGIAAAFVFSGGGGLGYAVAVLALALGDAAAGAFGARYGRHPFLVWGRTRSVEGSIAGFSASALVTFGVVAVLGYGAPAGIAMALLVGVASALAEAISVEGTDNLTIPLCVLAAMSASGSGPEAVAALLGCLAALLGAGIAASYASWAETWQPRKHIAAARRSHGN